MEIPNKQILHKYLARMAVKKLHGLLYYTHNGQMMAVSLGVRSKDVERKNGYHINSVALLA